MRWQRQLLTLVDTLEAARVRLGEPEFRKLGVSSSAKDSRSSRSGLMDLIVFENKNPFVIDEFRSATPRLTRAEIPRLAQYTPNVPEAEARRIK